MDDLIKQVLGIIAVIVIIVIVVLSFVNFDKAVVLAIEAIFAAVLIGVFLRASGFKL
jgi:hypothetical protein